MVGERGMQLSGGQRQRIALARAFLKNAPILILDEPTSSIDIKTEREIIEVMERLSIGRTVFIIAHRLSTLKHCDLLLGIEHGQVSFIRSDVSKAIGDPSVFVALTRTLYLEKRNLEGNLTPRLTPRYSCAPHLRVKQLIWVSRSVSLR